MPDQPAAAAPRAAADAPVFIPAVVPVFIDGLNLAYWAGQPPSLRVALTLLAALRGQGRPAQAIFDASTPHRIAENERALFETLAARAELAQVVPSGKPADVVLLRAARDAGGCVVSRDHFADHRRRWRRLIDDPARRFGGHVREGRLVVTALAIDVPMAASAEAALAALAGLVAPQANDPRCDAAGDRTAAT